MNFEYWFPTVTAHKIVPDHVKKITEQKVDTWINSNKHQTYVQECKEDNLITSYFKWHDTLGDINLEELREEILGAGADFAQHMGLALNSNDLKVDSWINFFYSSQSEQTHNHYGNFISGVYYVQGEQNSGVYRFYDPASQKTMWKGQFLSQATPNMTNLSSGNYVPEPGKLILFPSWLDHGVLANKSRSVRISIAFNINRKSK